MLIPRENKKKMKADGTLLFGSSTSLSYIKLTVEKTVT